MPWHDGLPSTVLPFSPSRMIYTQDTQNEIKTNKHHSSLIIVPPLLLAGVETEASLLLLVFAAPIESQ